MATSPYIKSLMRETGKSEREVSAAWKKAQELTSENFDMRVDEFEQRQYEYAVETAKNILGFEEANHIRGFYSSDKSAREYLEEVMTSGSLGVDLDHATMRGKKGEYPGVEMDDEEEERQSKEYSSIDTFNEPNSSTGKLGDDSGSNPKPDYGEEDEY